MLIALVFSLNTISGQTADISFKHITAENGLPQNTITGIVKDRYGFMWFGTWSGLCRFDGYRFRTYRYDKTNPRSLVSNRVMNIVSDKEENLWIVTLNDSILCRYRFETDDFDRIAAKNVGRDFRQRLGRNHHLDHIAAKYKGYKWDMGKSQKELVREDLKTGAVRRFEFNPLKSSSLNDALVTDMYLDDQHILWVGTFSNGINKTNLDAKPFGHYVHDPLNANSLIDNNIRAISEDRNGNIWAGTRDKGVSMISKDGLYRHLNTGILSDNSIKMIFTDSRGLLWIGSKKGIDLLDPNTNAVRHFGNSEIKKTYVFNAYEDHLHQIWFAAWNGIYKYDPSSDSLCRQKMPAMSHNSAMAIMEDRSHHIWIGTEGGGIAVFKPDRDNSLKLLYSLRQIRSNANSLSDDNVYAIYQDIDGMIWIGTDNGLNRFDPGSRSFKHFAKNTSITRIVEDNSGAIWVSHNSGLLQLNKRTLKIRSFTAQDGLRGNDFSDGAVFKSPSSGKLFFGGNQGFNIFHPDSIRPNPNVPKIYLTELQILNKSVNVNDTVNGRVLLAKPLYMTPEIDLNYKDQSIAIEFAGLHYANPSGIKYAYMLEGFDKSWIYTDASSRTAVYSNLSQGTYTFKVKAANSDGIWCKTPASLKINVRPPFWAGTWAYIFYVAAFFALTGAFYYYSLKLDRLKNKLGYENLLHEKELEMRQSKIEFYTNISHEIKTPLSLILTPIEQLRRENGDNPKIIKQLTTIKNSGDRLLKLINQLLDIRRFETGNDKLNLRQTDLIALIQSISESFDPMACENSIALEFRSSIEELSVLIDVDKMEKVFYNLLSNAFKFTPRLGCIKTVVQYGEEGILISVQDNGTGIPKDELEAVFKPFQQASTNKTGGTGLGLAYARALVELHGGIIFADSFQQEGERQTIFTVKLPLSLAVAPYYNLNPFPKSSIAMNTGLLAQEGGMDKDIRTLLIVEDNNELRNYLTDFFSETYNVLQASNGKEGFMVAAEEIPDLIISDVMMPEMDGFELCREIKTGTMTSHIPFILLSAKSLIESQIEGIATGADDYMTKPFNLELLGLKVKNLFLSQMKIREKYRQEINAVPSDDIPSSPDEKLLKKVIAYVEKHIGDPELDVEGIGREIGLSRSQLYRKMKGLTGLSMGEIVRDIRLKRASQLLAENKFNISEIAYMVGFTDPDYFRKTFKSHFGVSPSKYGSLK